MKRKFTDQFIKSLKTTGKAYSYGDTEHRGLRVRVSGNGIKIFSFAYRSRVDGKPRTLSFGECGQLTLLDAFGVATPKRQPQSSGARTRKPPRPSGSWR